MLWKHERSIFTGQKLGPYNKVLYLFAATLDVNIFCLRLDARCSTNAACQSQREKKFWVLCCASNFFTLCSFSSGGLFVAFRELQFRCPLRSTPWPKWSCSFFHYVYSPAFCSAVPPIPYRITQAMTRWRNHEGFPWSWESDSLMCTEVLIKVCMSC